MVNTVVLFDVPRRPARQRLEALLRTHGFVWLFPYARWSTRPLSRHQQLLRQVGGRLTGESYRIVFLEITARSRKEARWLTAVPTDSR